MPKIQIKDEKKTSSIPSYIIDSITSITPRYLMHSESCPPCPFEKFDIQEKLDENLEKKRKAKEAEYKIGNYLVKKTLGQGTFGKVKLGIYLPTQEKVAIKILEKERIVEKDDEIRVKREFDMLALFNHPNVILVAEIFESSDSFYSVMEYCQGGELFNYIVKNRRLNEDEAAFFYYQLINGLEYIHSLGIVHRDLKPENLLLTSEHLLKIIDFGLSNYFVVGQKELLSTPCGSPCYASPEMVGGHKYNGFKIDIWSSGIILYAMLCGYLPFEDKDNDVLFEKILECKVIFPKYIKGNSKDLIEKILVTDPEKRISIPEIKKHPFYLKGKELFEQEFSVYQIIKDPNDKTSFIENIDLNHIVDNPVLNETDKGKEKVDDKKNIENDNNKKIIKSDIDIEEKSQTNKESSAKKEKNNDDIYQPLKIKEIEIKNIGLEVIGLKKEKKEKVKNEKEKEKEKKLNEKIEDNIKTDKEILELKIKKEKKKVDSNKEKDENLYKSDNENLDKENDINIQNLNSIKKEKSKEKTKNNSKNKINNFVKNINTTSKKVDIFKKHKLVTLIKDKGIQTNIRRKLIKNKNKLNIREKTKSRDIKSSKKPNKIINYNYFKRKIKRKKEVITPNLKRLKYNSKKIISKKTSNNKIFQKKYSSKGSIKKQNLIYKINLYSNNINNTIDDGEIPKKTKLHFNFQKINISYVRSSKRANSTTKHNMKLNSFETSKTKKKKNFENVYENNSSIKKNIEFLSNNKKKYGKRFNLLYRKNVKELNIKIKNKKNNYYIEDENKKKILKTEISKEKGKNLLEAKGIKKMKIPVIKVEKNNNMNIKIVDNTKEEENEKNNNKNYNTKTNFKKANNNKLYKKVNEGNFLGNNEYIVRTFDKEKNDRIKKKSINKYNRISGPLNMNYLKKYEHKKTIDEDENTHRINIDISTNLGCTKNNSTVNNTNNNNSNNNYKEYNNSKKKVNKNENKIPIVKKFDKSKKDNLNINLDYNRKSLLKDINITDKNYNIKDIETILKTEPSKNPSISYKKKLNSNSISNSNEKEKKINLSHKKIAPVNPIKINNYRKIQKNNKKQNIPKILNKTSNSSYFNSFVKNPFIPSESTNFNTINQSISNSNAPQASNTLTKKGNNGKNSQKVLNNNKKKPFVTIRNTVINFNMIDSGLILASLNHKREERKKINSICSNNSVNRLRNNHLYGLCSKFNNNAISNVNNNDISIKTKTINVNSNSNLNFKAKKILNYRHIQSFKKGNNIINKNNLSNHDKFHMKFNSMRLEDYNSKGKKKNSKKKNNYTHKIMTSYNNRKMINAEQNYFNTINNEEIASRENHQNFINKLGK